MIFITNYFIYFSNTHYEPSSTATLNFTTTKKSETVPCYLSIKFPVVNKANNPVEILTMRCLIFFGMNKDSAD